MAFYNCLNFENFLQHWLNRTNSDEILSDIYDGQIWKSFKETNDENLPNFFRNKTADSHLGLMINLDWFQPYNCTIHSTGVIYAAICNLPRYIRFKHENLLILGLLLSPNEVSLHKINHYLASIVDKLESLWNGIILNKTDNCPNGKKIRAALILVRKICGHILALANYENRQHNFAGMDDMNNWFIAKNSSKHLKNALKWRGYNSDSARKKFTKNILWEYLEKVDRKILTYFVRICHLFVNRILETKSLDEIHKKIVDILWEYLEKVDRKILTYFVRICHLFVNRILETKSLDEIHKKIVDMRVRFPKSGVEASYYMRTNMLMEALWSLYFRAVFLDNDIPFGPGINTRFTHQRHEKLSLCLFVEYVFRAVKSSGGTHGVIVLGRQIEVLCHDWFIVKGLTSVSIGLLGVKWEDHRKGFYHRKSADSRMGEPMVRIVITNFLDKMGCSLGKSAVEMLMITLRGTENVVLWEYLEKVDRKILTYFVRICHLFVNRILETKSLDEIHKKIVDMRVRFPKSGVEASYYMRTNMLMEALWSLYFRAVFLDNDIPFGPGINTRFTHQRHEKLSLCLFVEYVFRAVKSSGGTHGVIVLGRQIEVLCHDWFIVKGLTSVSIGLLGVKWEDHRKGFYHRKSADSRMGEPMVRIVITNFLDKMGCSLGKSAVEMLMITLRGTENVAMYSRKTGVRSGYEKLLLVIVIADNNNNRCYIDVITLIEKKYGRNVITPNLHLSLHLSICLHDFGPLYAFWCFSFKRINGILGSLPNNYRQIEPELMRRLINNNYTCFQN
ncbi:hypothetical protein Glove_132g162 [Diversispora epigaea]|uniref:Uncharacterized protein n=1 Tax=Diversispora epigaea TaxID=1348612 RepID=A0A397J215_9GLOM|nr:hypothetical protein Glove_132g162 [Diversispora epigaea]